MERLRLSTPKEVVKRVGKAALLIPFMFFFAQISASGAPLNQKEITRGNSEKGIALTYDCGPWVASHFINKILDVLDEKMLKATFFVTGEFIRKNPGDFERIIYSGHEIANHSNTHPDFNALSNGAIKDELAATERRANEYGVSTIPLWRAPFGARSPRVLVAAQEEGYDPNVMWALDSSDWVAGATPESIKRRLLLADRGDIVVLHCNAPSGEILGEVIGIYANRGINVVTISELLN